MKDSIPRVSRVEKLPPATYYAPHIPTNAVISTRALRTHVPKRKDFVPWKPDQK